MCQTKYALSLKTVQVNYEKQLEKEIGNDLN